LGNSESASEEFEKAVGWFPDHNAATVDLCNMLLDYYCQKTPVSEPAAESSTIETPKSKPLLAKLPTRESAQTDAPKNSKPHRTVEESENLLSRLAARGRAYGLLSMLTKSGRGWDDSDAWFALARAYEESGEEEKAKEALWWVVELEETRPVRDWSCAGGF
ncbi:MAG: hypothetical protein Q9198_011409, partial [Flavoplaca austrocitrina]